MLFPEKVEKYFKFCSISQHDPVPENNVRCAYQKSLFRYVADEILRSLTEPYKENKVHFDISEPFPYQCNNKEIEKLCNVE